MYNLPAPVAINQQFNLVDKMSSKTCAPTTPTPGPDPTRQKNAAHPRKENNATYLLPPTSLLTTRNQKNTHKKLSCPAAPAPAKKSPLSNTMSSSKVPSGIQNTHTHSSKITMHHWAKEAS
jgi:hypothetical protein